MSLHSNTPNFLFENENRSFPFEDSKDLEKKLSFSSILDIKGFSRSPISSKVALIGISRWDMDRPQPTIIGASPSDSLYVSEEIEQGKVQFYFKFQSLAYAMYMTIGIDISNLTWPVFAQRHIEDEAATKYVSMSVLIGESILADFPTTRFTKFDDIFLEQSVIMECYKKSIDQFEIRHSNGSKDYVKGALSFSNGMNSSVTQSGQSIRINAGVGEGEGRGRNNSTEISEKCNGILTINGVPPDIDGKFKIQAGKGISVVDDPPNHKIIISIQQDSPLIECLEAP